MICFFFLKNHSESHYLSQAPQSTISINWQFCTITQFFLSWGGTARYTIIIYKFNGNWFPSSSSIWNVLFFSRTQQSNNLLLCFFRFFFSSFSSSFFLIFFNFIFDFLILNFLIKLYHGANFPFSEYFIFRKSSCFSNSISNEHAQTLYKNFSFLLNISREKNVHFRYLELLLRKVDTRIVNKWIVNKFTRIGTKHLYTIVVNNFPSFFCW